MKLEKAYIHREQMETFNPVIKVTELLNALIRSKSVHTARATEIYEINQSEFSEWEKLCYPTSPQLFAIKRPENHIKDFVATFCQQTLAPKLGCR